MNPITVWLGRLFIQTKYIGLPNIILNKPLVPELLQEDCTPEAMAQGISHLLKNQKSPVRKQNQGIHKPVQSTFFARSISFP